MLVCAIKICRRNRNRNSLNYVATYVLAMCKSASPCLHLCDFLSFSNLIYIVTTSMLYVRMKWLNKKLDGDKRIYTPLKTRIEENYIQSTMCWRIYTTTTTTTLYCVWCNKNVANKLYCCAAPLHDAMRHDDTYQMCTFYTEAIEHWIQSTYREILLAEALNRMHSFVQNKLCLLFWAFGIQFSNK